MQLLSVHSYINAYYRRSHNVGSIRDVVFLRLRSLIDPSFEFTVSAFVLPRVTGRIPSIPALNASWNHLADLSLADLNFAIPGPINLILEADVYGSLLRGPIKQGEQ